MFLPKFLLSYLKSYSQRTFDQITTLIVAKRKVLKLIKYKVLIELKMPMNGTNNTMHSEMLSGIEEETDIFEAFAPHVDTSTISISTENSPGML